MNQNQPEEKDSITISWTTVIVVVLVFVILGGIFLGLKNKDKLLTLIGKNRNSVSESVTNNQNKANTTNSSTQTKTPLSTITDETADWSASKSGAGVNPKPYPLKFIDIKSVTIDNSANGSGVDSDAIISFHFSETLPKTAADLPAISGDKIKTVIFSASFDLEYFKNNKISAKGPEILLTNTLYGTDLVKAQYQKGENGVFTQTFDDAKVEGGPGFDYITITYPHQNLSLPKSTTTFKAWTTATSDNYKSEASRDILENSHFAQTALNSYDLKVMPDQRVILADLDKEFAGKNISLALPFDRSKKSIGINSLGENSIHIEDQFGHAGWDFYWTDSVPIHAAAPGVVVSNSVAEDKMAALKTQWAMTVVNEQDKYYVSYIHLKSTNPDLKIGSVIKTGDLIGYGMAQADNPNSPSFHWTFGYYGDQAKRDWQERQKTGNSYFGIFPHFTSARCPLRFLSDADKSALSDNWSSVAKNDPVRSYFPNLCNNYYQD